MLKENYTIVPQQHNCTSENYTIIQYHIHLEGCMQ